MFSQMFNRSAVVTVENDRYYYIDKNILPEGMTHGTILNYPIERKYNQDGREYFIVRLPPKGNEIERHISIDRHISNQKSNYLLSCWHETRKYERTMATADGMSITQHEVTRIYCNRNGHFLRHTVHKVREDGIEEVMPQNTVSRSHIMQQALEVFKNFCAPFINLMYEQSSNMERQYRSLESQATNAQHQFKNSDYKNNEYKEEAINKLQKAIEILDERGKYNDFKHDNRINRLQEIIEHLNNGGLEKVINAVTSSSTESEIISQEKTKKLKNKTKKKKNNHGKQEGQSNDLTDRFAYTPDLVNSFKKQVDDGNIDEVKSIYNALKENSFDGFQELFCFFIEKLLMSPDFAYTDRLIELAMFFYVESEDYRHEVFRRNEERRVYGDDEENSETSDILMSAFVKNKFNVFKLLIEQGVHPFNKPCEVPYNSQILAFSLPRAIIYLHTNNNNNALPFIQLLREYKALNEEEPSEYTVKFMSQEEIRDFAYIPNLQEKTTNAFSFAMKVFRTSIGFSTELMLDLARNANLTQVIFEIPNILTQTELDLAMIPKSKCNRIHYVCSQKALKTKINELLSVGDSPNDKVALVLLSRERNAGSIVEELLRYIEEKFVLCEPAKQREIIQALVRQAKRQIASRQEGFAVSLIVGVTYLLSNLLTDLTVQDHVLRASLWCLMAKAYRCQAINMKTYAQKWKEMHDFAVYFSNSFPLEVACSNEASDFKVELFKENKSFELEDCLRKNSPLVANSMRAIKISLFVAEEKEEQGDYNHAINMYERALAVFDEKLSEAQKAKHQDNQFISTAEQFKEMLNDKLNTLRDKFRLKQSIQAYNERGYELGGSVALKGLEKDFSDQIACLK